MLRILKPIAHAILLWQRARIWLWQEIQKSLFAGCGSNVIIGKGCTFIHRNIYIGNNVFIGERASFIAWISKIYIGDNVMFGPNVTIRGGNHRIDVVGEYMMFVKEKLPENDRDVVIENDVWIGCNVTILSGVRIGEGSIIGAGSVVTKDVPSYTVLVGSPPRKSWQRWDDSTIEIHRNMLRQKYK